MKNTVTFNDGKDIIIEYLDYMNGVNKTNLKYTYQIWKRHSQEDFCRDWSNNLKWSLVAIFWLANTSLQQVLMKAGIGQPKYRN